jgi:hypothetical protein
VQAAPGASSLMTNPVCPDVTTDHDQYGMLRTGAQEQAGNLGIYESFI